MVRLPFVALLLLAVATLFLAPQTQASTLPDTITDPATLHIGPGGTTGCATGGCPVFGTELNGIPDGTLDIFQESGGAPSLLSPILLIFAVPNDTLGTDLTAANVGATATLEDSTGGFLGTEAVTFGVIPDATKFGATGSGLTGGTAGFQGPMTSGDVYTTLGIGASVTNSESFVNFVAADVAVGGFLTAPTGYGLYVFSIGTNNFAAKDFLQLTVSGIPQGTFAMGYGQDAFATCTKVNSHTGACQKFSGYSPYDTPFTEAGITGVPPGKKVPEPASLLMFGTGLLTLGTLLRRKLRS